MLDLGPIAGRIADAGKQERARQNRATNAAEQARLAAGEWTGAAQTGRVRSSVTSWLVAHTGDAPGARYCVDGDALPPAHVVVAADGSQIAPDRHDGAGSGCYLLNIGTVFLSYGTGQRARLHAVPQVLTIDDEEDDEAGDDGGFGAAARGLALRRFARELTALAALMAEAKATGLPALALTDGSLIAWQLQPDNRGDSTPAQREALQALKDTLAVAQDLQIPLVGYVSGPGSRDVINGLRVGQCASSVDKETVNCFHCPAPDASTPPCATLRHATDAALFARLLSPGERSATFTAQGQVTGYSRILDSYGPAHWPAFFYVNVGAEIARVEIPAWVARDPALVGLAHAVCADQARKGNGYPVALSEAHERAVVREADRQQFLHLLHRAMVNEGGQVAPTRKAHSKRTRAV